MRHEPRMALAKRPEQPSPEAKRLKDAVRRLILDQPFFGMLALRLRIEEDAAAETAWVNGVTLGYNAAFVDGLTDAELTGLICHEVLHVAAGHPWRRGHREKRRWNLACDFAINPIAIEAGLLLPKSAAIDAAFRGLSSEVIYERIASEPPADQSGQGSAGGDGGSPEGSGPESPGPSQDESGPSPMPPPEYPTEGAPIPGEVRDAPADRSDQLEAEWRMAVESAGRVAGHLPRGLRQVIDEVKRPVVNWREVLRAFVQRAAGVADYSFRRPNRRFSGMGLYLPELVEEGIRTAVVAVDTSGSVSDEWLKQFHGEVRSILDEVKPARTVVIYCDAAVQATTEAFPDDAFVFEPQGRGGTSFVPVFEWVAENDVEPDFLIYLTDLEGRMPELAPSYPVLWVTTPTQIEPAWGEKVELTG